MEFFLVMMQNQMHAWEVGRTTNIGLDYAILDGKLRGSVNAYMKETKNLIASSSVDPFTNFGNRIDANIGDMENKGIELSFDLVISIVCFVSDMDS